MMTRNDIRLARAAALALLFTAACDDAEFEVPEDEVALRDGPGQSGPVLNTHTIFTSDVAQVDTTGQALNGVTLTKVAVLDGVVLKALDADTLQVVEGTVQGEVGGVLFEGFDFIGSRWTFNLGSATVIATLTDVENANIAGLYDPWLTSDHRKLDPNRLVYAFHYEDEDDNEFTTCTEDTVGGAWAVLYNDFVVDHETGQIEPRINTVYFGCLSGAVGKAALWGYAPDSPSLPSVSLAAFETATRVVRADYCADGEAHTIKGNLLTLHDRWGINVNPGLPGFATEAVWQAGGGAKCLQRIRLDGKALDVAHVCPDGRTISLCGADAVVGNRWATGWGHIWTRIVTP